MDSKCGGKYSPHSRKIKVKIMVYHIIVVVSSVCGMYFLADSINEMSYKKEDNYLPRKWRKLSPLFRFTTRNRPIRFRAYWLQKIAQIALCIDVIVLIIGRVFTKSFAFAEYGVFRYYPLLVFSVPLLFELSILIYILIKEHLSGE